MLNPMTILDSCMRYGKTYLKDGTLAQAPAMRECESYIRLEGVGESYSGHTPAQRSGHSTATSWLPTDIKVEVDESIVVKEYFNNVHPADQEGLHEGLTALLRKFIPMFDRLLADLRNYIIKTVLGDEQSELDETTRPVNPKTNEPVEYWEDDEDEIEETPRAWENWLATAPYIDPKPGKYQPEMRFLGTGYTLKGKTVQIIAKIAEM